MRWARMNWLGGGTRPATGERRIERSRMILTVPPEATFEESTDKALISHEELTYEVAAPLQPLVVGETLSLQRRGRSRTYRVTHLAHGLHEWDGTVDHTLFVMLEDADERMG